MKRPCLLLSTILLLGLMATEAVAERNVFRHDPWVLGGDQGRFIVDDRSAPGVKFLHLQAFGGLPPVVENRSATNTLVVESCDLRGVGRGG